MAIIANGLEDSMKFFYLAALCLTLTACSMARVSDNQSSYDNARRMELKPLALQGNQDAQYELGNSYCCGNSGFWDTKQAIFWWCKASEQGHSKARERLLQQSAECRPSR